MKVYISTCNWIHFDGLVQERCNSSALAMELQGVQRSGKSQGNSRLGKSQGKVREFR